MLRWILNCSGKPHSQCRCVLPSAGSLAGSPHLSELSINSQGGPAMANVTLSPNLSPDNRQASPLVSPLLNDQTGIRTDDEEEVRRKVLMLMPPLFPFFLSGHMACLEFLDLSNSHFLDWT